MDDINSRLLDFALIMTRISAFLLLLPIFGSKSIPVRLKVSIMLILSVFFWWLIPLPARGGQVTMPGSILLICIEAVYGLALGIIATVIFSAVRIGAAIVEMQMGFRIAEILDPITGESSQPLESLIETTFILLFLSANGHHLFLTVISRSYTAFPPGRMPTLAIMTNGIIQAGTVMFTAGLKLAAPMLAGFIVLVIVLAVFARVVPEMNIFFISMALRIGLGLIVMAIFIPYISPFISEFAELINRLLPL